MSLLCREIVERLQEAYPVSYAEEWDNVGLLVGRQDISVEKAYVALDLTETALDEAISWGADLILTHHPMIFGSLKQISDQDFIGRKVLKLAENRIAYYAMHTNFDVLSMAEINEGLLELSDTQVLLETGTGQEGKTVGIGRVGTLPREMKLEECACFVKEKFALQRVKVYGDLGQTVRKAAVSGGSGKSMVKNALSCSAQVLITGDIDHHTGLDAVDQGLCVIDAGHYGTEYFFISYMKRWMEKTFPQLQLRTAAFQMPFSDI